MRRKGGELAACFTDFWLFFTLFLTPAFRRTRAHSAHCTGVHSHRLTAVTPQLPAAAARPLAAPPTHALRSRPRLNATEY